MLDKCCKNCSELKNDGSYYCGLMGRCIAAFIFDIENSWCGDFNNKENWLNKMISKLTIEDLLEANQDGVYFVCEDGKIKEVVGDSGIQLINILQRKEVINYGRY